MTYCLVLEIRSEGALAAGGGRETIKGQNSSN